ncbi:MAG TPA: HAMP domain-containing histidine kinase [Bacteroides mediterraneensis]|uniref:sensor histidine kinase n=1 Tax=Bacteroides mediterraneensis TaxID=1841856 RepID=UPI0026025537|nr:HAMP domain-containing sensor histidine kinase [Bacteroides mediterraneensis]HJH63912.1 HAMP domain-containing histidine kinase [Bacteroides mediterraneensis]
MKLFHLVMWRMSAMLVVILTCWAVLFYLAVMEEVNDEVDDSLSDYAESLIIRSLSGEKMPDTSNGSNNQYFLYDVSAEYAASYPKISYRDEMVYITAKGETEPARILMTIFQKDDGGYMELVVYTPTIEKYDLQRAILGWIVFLYVLLLLMILAVNAWVFYRNMRPLYTLLKWLENYRLGSKREPLDESLRIVEFRKLNEAANLFSERSEQLYEQQKLFIGNASHEMQTPLAICRNRLEMLMEDDTLTEKQLSELMKTHRTLENLTRLNKSLLLLCKIDNRQFTDVKPICLNELLMHYLDDYKEVYAYRRVQVNVHVEDCFQLEMSEALATVLLTNLLKNAFVHTSEGGTIELTFTASSFEIRNTGEASLDKNRIFERFYKEGKKEGSTGLGLALVDSICKAYRLNLSYRFENGMHIFTIIS